MTDYFRWLSTLSSTPHVYVPPPSVNHALVMTPEHSLTKRGLINCAKESTGEPKLELNCPIITLTEYLLLTKVSESLVLNEVIALLL